MGRLAVQLYDPESNQVHEENLLPQEICSKMKLFDAYSRSRSRGASPGEQSRDEFVEEEEASTCNLDPGSDNWPGLASDSPPRERLNAAGMPKFESHHRGLYNLQPHQEQRRHPHFIQLSENTFQERKPALVESQESQEISAKTIDEEPPANRERLNPQWQAKS